jgi:hypothetical protein
MASKSTKKKHDTKLEQPAAPAAPPPEADLSEEAAQGYVAWQQQRAAIEACAARAKAQGLGVLALGYDVIARRLGALVGDLAPELPAILARLSAAEAAEVEQAFKQLLPLARAARFVAGQYERSKAAADVSDVKRRAADREALLKGRPLALRYLAMCATLGLIAEEEVEAIRRGVGLLDYAQDHERIGAILKDKWADLAPALALVKDKDAALTLEKVEQMIALGARVADAIKTDGAKRPDTLGIRWSTQRLGVGHLLHERWSVVRRAALYHYDAKQDTAMLARLRPLKGLQGR